MHILGMCNQKKEYLKYRQEFMKLTSHKHKSGSVLTTYVDTRCNPIYIYIHYAKMGSNSKFMFQNSNQKVKCFNVLLVFIERKVELAGDICSKPPITTRSHDLHTSGIRVTLERLWVR
jgi:hypothetical protein